MRGLILALCLGVVAAACSKDELQWLHATRAIHALEDGGAVIAWTDGHWGPWTVARLRPDGSVAWSQTLTGTIECVSPEQGVYVGSGVVAVRYALQYGSDTATFRLVAFDLQTGHYRWDIYLGLNRQTPPDILHGETDAWFGAQFTSTHLVIAVNDDIYPRLRCIDLYSGSARDCLALDQFDRASWTADDRVYINTPSESFVIDPRRGTADHLAFRPAGCPEVAFDAPELNDLHGGDPQCARYGDGYIVAFLDTLDSLRPGHGRGHSDFAMPMRFVVTDRRGHTLRRFTITASPFDLENLPFQGSLGRFAIFWHGNKEPPNELVMVDLDAGAVAWRHAIGTYGNKFEHHNGRVYWLTPEGLMVAFDDSTGRVVGAMIPKDVGPVTITSFAAGNVWLAASTPRVAPFAAKLDGSSLAPRWTTGMEIIDLTDEMRQELTP